MRFLLLPLACLLLSCGGARPLPTTQDQCSTDHNVRETCWTCASEPSCAWWGTEDSTVRGCYARSEHPPLTVSRVVISDACNQLPLDAAR